jgi:CubicO group peptidase (beta-lactamase class C family)
VGTALERRLAILRFGRITGPFESSRFVTLDYTMSTHDDPIPLVDVNDPVFTFLTGTAPPLARIARSDVENALKHLRDAARMAVTPDGSGKRWLPGLSIVVVGGDPGNYHVLCCEGFGTKSVADPAPVGPDTLFPCASLSKPVSSSLLAHVGAGTIKPQWSDVAPQADGTSAYFLKRAPESKTRPTLRQWLSHRSGLPDHAGDLIEDMNPAMSSGQILARIMNDQTGITPGDYAYTNFGFTMGCLGALKAARNHVNWDDFADEQFRELGMLRSTYRFTSAFAHPDVDRVLPHRGETEVPDLLSPEPIGWMWRVVDRDQERNPTRQAPAGGLLSSAHDLGVFLLKHLNEEFGKTFPARKPDDDELLRESHWYSLGWNIANHSDEQAFTSFGTSARNAVSFSHSGAFTLGAGTCLRFDPDAGYGIAILSNGAPTGVPEALSQIFFKYLYATPMPPGCDHAAVLALCRVLYMSELYKKKIANYRLYHSNLRPIPDDLPEGRIFSAHSDYYACDIAIEHTKPDLVLKMGNAAAGGPMWTFKLARLGQSSSYAYTTAGENEVGLSAIRFTWQGNVLIRVDDAWLEDSGPGLGEFRSITSVTTETPPA